MNPSQYHQLLTYDYSDYKSRELIYSQIISQYHASLKPEAHLKRELDISRSFDLKTKGICSMPNIDKNICAYIKNKFFTTEGKISGEKRIVSPATLTNDAILMQIFCDKKIIRPIQNYLGIFPSIQFISGWENQGGYEPTRTNEMYWHMDHHGHRFVKVFYYLDEMKLGMGHHQFIKNTHNQKRFDKLIEELQPYSKHLEKIISRKRTMRGKLKINDDSILPIMENIINVIGMEGTGFAEDTRGLHRGTPLPPNSRRRIIQCLFVPFANGKDTAIDLENYENTKTLLQKQYTDIEIKKLLCLTNHNNT